MNTKEKNENLTQIQRNSAKQAVAVSSCEESISAIQRLSREFKLVLTGGNVDDRKGNANILQP